MKNENDNGTDRHRKNIDQIRALMIEGSEPQKDKKQKEQPSNFNSISGNNNIIGFGNSLNIYNAPPVEKKVVVVKTGDGVLTAQQKSKINQIIKEWIDARGAVRRSKSEISSFRSAFNKAMKVNSYHEILQEDFDKAVAWLRRQVGIVYSMASASKKIPDWRKKRYAQINARAKEFLDGEVRYRSYAQKRFGSDSLKALSDEQLDAVYRYVFGWRRTK